MQTFKPIKKRLGGLLVETNLINDSQLAAALDFQNKKGVKIGHALLELGYVTKDLLLAFLGRQCGISYVSLKEFGAISREAVSAVPEYLARQWEIFPLTLENGKITVAVSDPFNLFAVDDLRLITGFDVKTVIAPADEIKAFTDKYYVSQGLAAGRDRGDALENAVALGAALGVTEMYFADGLIRYFFGLRHIKSVEVAEKEKESLLKNISRQPARTMEINRVCPAAARPSAERWLVKSSPSAGKIKLRNLSCAPSLKELGIEPDDIMLLEKHLNSGRGVTVVSAGPSSGKTVFMSAVASSCSSPHKITYYFSSDSSAAPENLLKTPVICRELSRESLRFLPGAHCVFFDSYDLPPEDILRYSQNSAVVLACDEETPPVPADLYVRLKLLRRLCPECRVKYAVSREYIVNSGIPVEIKDEEVILSKAEGCASCGFTGYSGVSAVCFITEEFEKLSCAGIRAKILESIWSRALAGEISVEEVLFHK